MEPSHLPSHVENDYGKKSKLPLILGLLAVLGIGLAGGYFLSKHLQPDAVTLTQKLHPPEASPAAPSVNKNEPVDHDVVVAQDEWRTMMAVDMTRLLQDAKINRYRENGEIKGLHVTRIRPGSLYELVGLKDNDVVEQLNGIAVADMEKTSTAALSLPQAKSFLLRVRRDGRLVTLRVRVAEAPPATATP